MSREMCWRCFWPQALCWCSSIVPQLTRTRFVFLMHPKEYKREKAATGRLAHLSLSNSLIRVGVGFDGDSVVQTIINDPTIRPFLLYPGAAALNLSTAGMDSFQHDGRPITVFLLDGTWATAKVMFRSSPSLQALPRLMFTTGTKSRYTIKQQPNEWCLSTLEATHELLLAMAATGIDEYPAPQAMPNLFEKMQDFQIVCAAEALHGPHVSSYRPRHKAAANSDGLQVFEL